MRIIAGVVVALLATWLLLVAALLVVRPRGAFLGEAMRLLPDTLRLLKNLATDRAVLPFDVIPDFIPVLGYADDVIIAVIVLRSVVRRAGPDAIRRHWPGTPDGLAALARAAKLNLDNAA